MWDNAHHIFKLTLVTVWLEWSESANKSSEGNYKYFTKQCMSVIGTIAFFCGRYLVWFSALWATVCNWSFSWISSVSLGNYWETGYDCFYALPSLSVTLIFLCTMCSWKSVVKQTKVFHLYTLLQLLRYCFILQAK